MENTTVFQNFLTKADTARNADFLDLEELASLIYTELLTHIEERVNSANIAPVVVLRTDVESYVTTHLENIQLHKRFPSEETRLCFVVNVVMQMLAKRLINDGACVYRWCSEAKGGMSEEAIKALPLLDLCIDIQPDSQCNYLEIEEVDKALATLRHDWLTSPSRQDT